MDITAVIEIVLLAGIIGMSIASDVVARPLKDITGRPLPSTMHVRVLKPPREGWGPGWEDVLFAAWELRKLRREFTPTPAGPSAAVADELPAAA